MMEKIRTKKHIVGIPIGTEGITEGDVIAFYGDGRYRAYYTNELINNNPDYFEKIHYFSWLDFLAFAENHPTISKTDLDEFYENNVQRKAF